MLKVRALRLIIIAISTLALAALAAPVFAWDYGAPVIVDASQARDRSMRDDRDAVEGFWGMYMEWQPEEGASRRVRMVIVKNDYDAYEGADYVGVVTCDRPGCTRGEIKIALKKTGDPKKFDTTLLMKGNELTSGIAALGPHNNTEREDSRLDLTSLKYMDRMLTYGLIRIMGG